MLSISASFRPPLPDMLRRHLETLSYKDPVVDFIWNLPFAANVFTKAAPVPARSQVTSSPSWDESLDIEKEETDAKDIKTILPNPALLNPRQGVKHDESHAFLVCLLMPTVFALNLLYIHAHSNACFSLAFVCALQMLTETETNK